MEEKENSTKNVRTKIRDVENRILELETSMLYFSKAHSEIIHNLNNSAHNLLSNSYILGRYIEYFEQLVNVYQELSSKEVDSKINEIKRFNDGVEVESIRRLSTEAVKSIETSVKEIYKNTNELNQLTKQLGKVI